MWVSAAFFELAGEIPSIFRRNTHTRAHEPTDRIWTCHRWPCIQGEARKARRLNIPRIFITPESVDKASTKRFRDRGEEGN